MGLVGKPQHGTHNKPNDDPSLASAALGGEDLVRHVLDGSQDEVEQVSAEEGPAGTRAGDQVEAADGEKGGKDKDPGHKGEGVHHGEAGDNLLREWGQPCELRDKICKVSLIDLIKCQYLISDRCLILEIGVIGQ